MTVLISFSSKSSFFFVDFIVVNNEKNQISLWRRKKLRKTFLLFGFAILLASSVALHKYRTDFGNDQASTNAKKTNKIAASISKLKDNIMNQDKQKQIIVEMDSDKFSEFSEIDEATLLEAKKMGYIVSEVSEEEHEHHKRMYQKRKEQNAENESIESHEVFTDGDSEKEGEQCNQNKRNPGDPGAKKQPQKPQKEKTAQKEAKKSASFEIKSFDPKNLYTHVYSYDEEEKGDKQKGSHDQQKDHSSDDDSQVIYKEHKEDFASDDERDNKKDNKKQKNK